MSTPPVATESIRPAPPDAGAAGAAGAADAARPAAPEAPAAAVAGGAKRWQVPAEDHARLRAGPVLCRLVDHSVLDFEGPDAVAFLQGQTTVDIGALAAQSWQLGGYCTPKGRLLAVFQAWQVAQGVRLLLPTAIAATVARRLGMYVLRAKVRVRDASADWRAYALLTRAAPSGALAALQGAGVVPHAAAWQTQPFGVDDAARLATLPCGASSTGRWLAVVPTALGDEFERALGLPLAGAELYWWSQIDAAVPAIFPETSELFVPQTVNLEVLGGVNFRKGCYPGQEIVARSQYLGKLRRRLALAHAPELGPGADVYLDGKADPVGRIVMAATAPDEGWDLLFECPADALQEGARLRAGAVTAAPLQPRTLPYAIFDPTA